MKNKINPPTISWKNKIAEDSTAGQEAWWQTEASSTRPSGLRAEILPIKSGDEIIGWNAYWHHHWKHGNNCGTIGDDNGNPVLYSSPAAACESAIEIFGEWAAQYQKESNFTPPAPDSPAAQAAAAIANKNELHRRLHCAASSHNKVDEIKQVLAAGAEVEYLCPVTNNTAMLIAAGWGVVENINVLLATGGNPNSKDRHEITPLMSAAGSGWEGAVEALLAAGAEVNHQQSPEHGGWTALMMAADGGRVGVVELLLAAGANPLLKNHLKKTALYYAKNRRRRANKEAAILLSAAEKSAHEALGLTTKSN